MRIGIVGPVSLDTLRWPDGRPDDLPELPAATVISTLADWLLDQGHEVTLFTTADQVFEPRTVTSGPLTVCVVPQRRRGKGQDFFAVERYRLGKALAANPCDVLHAQWSYEYAQAALDSGMPTLVTVRDHALTILRHQRDLHRAARCVMNAGVLRRAPRFTVTSPYLHAKLPRAVRRRAVVIPNPLAPGILARGRDNAAGPARHAVTIGHGFEGRKNTVAALAAVGLLRSRGEDWRLELIGAGMQEGGPAHEWARARRLDDGVVFSGPIPFAEAMERVASSSVLLHVSLEEAFGMTILEAMGLGVPVVGGRRSGNVPYLLEDGRCGVLCDARDPADIAAALAGLDRDPGMRADLVARACRRAADYSVEVVGPRFVREYLSVLGGPRGLGPEVST